MSQNINLAQNTLYLTLASVGQKAVAFLYFAMIARFMGVENTGSYFLALAVIMILMALDDIGITSVLIREVARKTQDALLWARTVLGVKLITIPLTATIAYFLPLVFGYEAEIIYLIRLAIIIMITDTLSLSFYGILRGLHMLKYEAIGLFVGQIISATVGTLFLYFEIATLPMLIVALISGSVWNMVFSTYFVVKKLGIQVLIPTWALAWDPLKMAFAFFLAGIFVKVYSYIDSIILSLTVGEHAVGMYAVAYKLTYAFQFIPLAFVAALYPAMSARSKEPNRLRQTFLDALWYVMLVGSPIVFGIWALAPEIIDIFYGNAFADSVLPLQILVFVLIFIFLDFPVGSLLNSTNRQAIKTAIMGCTMIVNILANLILIPLYEASGAALAGLISFIFMFVIGWYFAQRTVNVNIGHLLKVCWGGLLAGGIMAIIVYFSKPFLPFALSIMLGVIVYMICIFIFKVVGFQHVNKFLRLIKPESVYEYPHSND